MKNTFLLLTLFVLLINFKLIAQEAPETDNLKEMLHTFLDGASRGDIAIHDNFWAEDLVYTSSAGLRYGKKEIMKNLKDAPGFQSEAPVTAYTADDIIIRQYGDMAVVAFKMTGTTTTSETVTKNYFLNSGTFLKRDGRWQVVNWQATKTHE